MLGEKKGKIIEDLMLMFYIFSEIKELKQVEIRAREIP